MRDSLYKGLYEYDEEDEEVDKCSEPLVKIEIEEGTLKVVFDENEIFESNYAGKGIVCKQCYTLFYTFPR